MQERDHRFDNLKGLMIFFVVLGHCMPASTLFLTCVKNALLSFHMPVFVFMSGYFYGHSIEKHGSYPSVVRCLIPYIISGIILSIVRLTVFNPFSPPTSLWYMLSMFFWTVLALPVSRIRFIIPISILLSLFAGTQAKLGAYLSLSRTITFFPCFLSGYYVYRHHKLDQLRRIPGPACTALFILAQAAVVFLTCRGVSGQAYQLRTAYASMKQGTLQGIVIRSAVHAMGFAGILFFVRIAPVKETCLSKIGQNSITVYLFHYALIVLYRYLPFRISSPYADFSAAVVLSAVICILLGNSKVHQAYMRLTDLAAKAVTGGGFSKS